MNKPALWSAAKAWKAYEVERILTAYPDWVTAQDPSGRTALHLCASSSEETTRLSSLEAVRTAQVLLDFGAEVNAVHPLEEGDDLVPATPLWYTLAKGHNRILALYLLAQGAKPDYCLWAATDANDIELTQRLLSHGADLEERLHGETPLLYAARLGREQITGLLLAHGANRSARDARGLTALDYAQKRRFSPETLKLLQEV